MYSKFGEISTCDFRDVRQTDRQTDRQTPGRHIYRRANLNTLKPHVQISWHFLYKLPLWLVLLPRPYWRTWVQDISVWFRDQDPHCAPRSTDQGQTFTFNTLKMICNDFLPTWLKVVSSCLLQYKPVCVTNFDKLCRKMVKKCKFIGRFGIAILRHVWRHSWVRLFCLRWYALLRLDKKLILPVYVLRTYFYVVMPMCCVISHSTLQ